MTTEDIEVRWLPVAGVQPVVFVAKSGDRPVAVLELRPGRGYQLTSCAGELVGDFASAAEGQAALVAWLRAGARASLG